MNINTLNDYIEQFETEIIESGFKRDIQDYIGSLPNNQNNIVSLREIAKNILEVLNKIYKSDLSENLEKLLPDKIKPFTKTNFYEDLQNLINNKEIEQNIFFQKLSQIIAQLNKLIQVNIAEIEKIKQFIKPYISSQDKVLSADEKAIVSIIFNEEKAISELKEFTKNLQNWNKIIPIYHQILSSSSPEDIRIVNVQNGSIDLLINLNVDLAINLEDLFKIGYKTFLTYLSYRKMIKPIVENYFGNKKLILSEKEREKELINNIGEAIKHKIIEQHKEALKTDTQIEKNSDKKIIEVVKLITSHILKGNEFKLLALPETNELKNNTSEENSNQELREISTQIKQAKKELPPSELKKLLTKYEEPNKDLTNE